MIGDDWGWFMAVYGSDHIWEVHGVNQLEFSHLDSNNNVVLNFWMVFGRWFYENWLTCMFRIEFLANWWIHAENGQKSVAHRVYNGYLSHWRFSGWCLIRLSQKYTDNASIPTSPLPWVVPYVIILPFMISLKASSPCAGRLVGPGVGDVTHHGVVLTGLQHPEASATRMATRLDEAFSEMETAEFWEFWWSDQISPGSGI